MPLYTPLTMILSVLRLLEAMMAGLPVFVNDWEVMEITEEGKIHWLIMKLEMHDELLTKFESLQQTYKILFVEK
jgi:hypothetical protein